MPQSASHQPKRASQKDARGNKSPKRRLRKIAWLFGLSLLLVVIAVAYLTSDRFIREQSIRVLEGATGGQVEIEQGQISVLKHIRLKNLEIYPPGAPQHPKHLVLHSTEILLHHNPWMLLIGQFELEGVTLIQPRLSILYMRDTGQSNLDFLFQQEKEEEEGKPVPAIFVQDSTLTYQELRGGESLSKAKLLWSGKISPIQGKPDTYDLSIRSKENSVLEHAYLGGQINLGPEPSFKATTQVKLENVSLNDLPLEWISKDHAAYVKQVFALMNPRGSVRVESAYDSAEGPRMHVSLSEGAMRFPESDINLNLLDLNTSFTCTRNGVVLHDLHGTLEEHCDFFAHGVFEGYSKDAPLNVTMGTGGLEIPVYQWDPNTPSDDYRKSKFIAMLQEWVNNEPLNNFFADLVPTGRLDVEMQVQRKKDNPGKPTFRGTVSCHDVNMNYVRFPYPLTHISGPALFDPNQVRVGPLLSRQGDQEVTYQDHWYFENGKLCYNIEVDALDGQLDEKLYNALPTEHQALWDQFKPTGLAHAHYRMLRDSNGVVRSFLDVDMLDVKAAYKGFAVPLEHIKGHLSITPEISRILIREAVAADGLVSLEGALRTVSPEQVIMEGEVHFNDLKLDDDFIRYLPAQIQSFYKQIGVVGRSTGNARLRSVLLEGQPTSRLGFDIQATNHLERFNYEGFPYELRDVEARVHITEEQLGIERLRGRNGQSTIHLSGTVRNPDDFQLKLRSESLALTDELQLALNRYRPEFWERFNPSGKAHIDLEIKKNPSQTDLVVEGMIEPLGVQCQLRPFRYKFENVRGRIHLSENLYSFDTITSTRGNERIELSGSLEMGADINGHWLVKADSIHIDSTWQDFLPQALRNAQDYLELEGTGDADIALSYRAVSEKTGLWKAEGTLALSEAKVTEPLASDRIQLQLEGEASYDSIERQFDLKANLKDSRLRVRKKLAHGIEARVRYDGKEKKLEFTDLKGKFYQGKLGGHLNMMFDDIETKYNLELKVHDVDLARMVEQENRNYEISKNLRGKLNGWYNLSKTESGSPQRGRFQFEVNEAVLGELSVLARFLHVAHLTWPKEGAFNEVKISGNVSGSQTQFDSIYMKGSALSLTGLGQMKDPNANLDLVFVVGSPHDLAPLPGIDLIKIISPALLHLRVSGSLDALKVESIPLPAFEKAIKYFGSHNLGLAKSKEKSSL
jgi:hypothetical protein